MARGDGGVGVEAVGRHELRHLGMARRGLEILAHRQKIDLGRAHVVHHLMHLHPFLAQSHHDAGLGEDRRIVPLHALQEAQRGVVARARPDGGIEARHRLQIVVVDVRASLDDRLHGRLRLVAEVGRQDLDGGVRSGPAEGFDHRHELPRPAVGQIVAIHAGDHDVLEAQASGRVGDVLRLRRVHRARHPRLDVAEGAGAGAHVRPGSSRSRASWSSTRRCSGTPPPRTPYSGSALASVCGCRRSPPKSVP